MTPRMHERPQAPLTRALRSLGYQIDSENDRLPAVIHGGEGRPGTCRVGINESSQFASALILAVCTAAGPSRLMARTTRRCPTSRCRGGWSRRFPAWRRLPGRAGRLGGAISLRRGRSATRSMSRTGRIAACRSTANSRGLPLPAEVSRTKDLGDSIMTAIVVAPFADHPVRFTNLGRLRVQECERVLALRTELTKCGARVEEDGDTLTVYPSMLHGAEIETYQDHRMAMCFAVLGLAVEGITLLDPGGECYRACPGNPCAGHPAPHRTAARRPALQRAG